MSISISVDGGGTKLNVIAFDSNFKLVGRASTRGTNLLFNKLDEVIENVDNCFNACLEGICNDKDVKAVYISLAGESNLVYEHIESRFSDSILVNLGEYPCAMLAGGLCDEGIIALSGTGGGIFQIRIGENIRGIGGWGALMGDWGSGFWIGQQGCYATVKMLEGWGDNTKIYDEIMSEYGLINLRELVDYVYKSKSYQQTIAGMSKAVSRAAAKGDTIALEIIKRAGVFMARQLIAMISKYDIQTDSVPVIINGGAWKGSVVMFNSFVQTVHQTYPNLTINKPLFEPVMGGVIKALMDSNVDISTDILEQLKTNFECYLWKGVGYAAE